MEIVGSRWRLEHTEHPHKGAENEQREKGLEDPWDASPTPLRLRRRETMGPRARLKRLPSYKEVLLARRNRYAHLGFLSPLGALSGPSLQEEVA